MPVSEVRDRADEEALVGFLTAPQSPQAASTFHARFGPFIQMAAADARDLVDRGLVEDVYMEVVLLLAEGRRTFRPPGHPRAFLRFVTKDAVRTIRRVHRWVDGPADEEPARPAPPPVRLKQLDAWARLEARASRPTKSHVPLLRDRVLAESSRVDSLRPPAYITRTPETAGDRRVASRRQLDAAPSAERQAIARISAEAILTYAARKDSHGRAAALVAAASGVPWTTIGRALKRDPATLKYHVHSLRAPVMGCAVA
jgi:DNA-directed RNA polymerase specialized sigma24 family protein